MSPRGRPPRGARRSVRRVMGMGGAEGPEADRRRRFVAALVVVAMLLAAGATVLSIVLS